MEPLLPLIATVIAVVFAALTARQYFTRRKPQQLAWTVGLLLFALATGAEYVSATWGWSAALYRVYYVASAALVGYLGLGTAYLVAPRRAVHVAAVILVLLTGAMLAVALTSPLDASILDSVRGHAIGGLAWAGSASVRAFSPIITVPGSLALIGGALYSAWMAWRNGGGRPRIGAMLLIAIGALLLASSGGLARMGWEDGLYFGEMIGIIAMFIGFLIPPGATMPKRDSDQRQIETD